MPSRPGAIPGTTVTGMIAGAHHGASDTVPGDTALTGDTVDITIRSTTLITATIVGDIIITTGLIMAMDTVTHLTIMATTADQQIHGTFIKELSPP